MITERGRLGGDTDVEKEERDDERVEEKNTVMERENR